MRFKALLQRICERLPGEENQAEGGSEICHRQPSHDLEASKFERTLHQVHEEGIEERHKVKDVPIGSSKGLETVYYEH